MRTEPERYQPIDERPAGSVRALILVRSSDLNKKADKTESQLAACEAFVKEMGWTLIGVKDERVSGFKRVKRPLLDEIMGMMQRRELDVVVCTELERISRDKNRQHALLSEAERWGCEFRFVEFKDRRGKLPDDVEASAYLAMRQLFGEMERAKIVERTQRGKATRAAKRIPGGGNVGAPYGYEYVFPPVTDGRRRTHIGLAIVEAEAIHVRWMFEEIDSNEQASVRSLAMRLNAQGVPTRGRVAWTVKSVIDKLHNPLYCGQAQILRWQSVTTRERDKVTGEMHDVTRNMRRAADDVLPAAEGTAPAIVSVELWQRVQAKLQERKGYAGKLSRHTSERDPEATLLHAGIARCAHCGYALVRYWKYPKGREPIPMYRCTRAANAPQGDCRAHEIAAQPLDDLVLHLIATALADPEKMLQLADASGVQYTLALEDIERNAGRLADIKKRSGELEALRKVYQKNQASLEQIGDREMAQMYSGRLEQVASELAEIDQEIQAIGPRQSRAAERAAFLENLRSIRSVTVDFGKGEIVAREFKPGLKRTLGTDIALRLLGVEQLNQYRESQGQPPLPAGWTVNVKEVEEMMTTDQWEVPTPEVLVQLMRKAPHAEVRKLLRELGVKVLVSRPRGKSEGYTPISERVTVELFSSSQQAVLTLRASDSKMTTCEEAVSASRQPAEGEARKNSHFHRCNSEAIILQK